MTQVKIFCVLSESEPNMFPPQVNHSQSFQEKVLLPWIISKPDGEVVAAHCTCMAGLGEACSHIGAVLFYIVAVVQHQDGEACTEKENSWRPPRLKSVPCAPISDLDFSSSQMRKRKFDKMEIPEPSSPQTSPARQGATDEEWHTFLQELKGDTKPALFSLLPGYSDDFVPAAAKYEQVLLAHMFENRTPSEEEMAENCESCANTLFIEPEVC